MLRRYERITWHRYQLLISGGPPAGIRPKRAAGLIANMPSCRFSAAYTRDRWHLDDAYLYLGLSEQAVDNLEEAREAFAKLKVVPGISPRDLLWTLCGDATVE
jgi:hypothetical protein